MPCLLHQISNTELLSETDDETLLISTLDGALHAITKSSGAHKWTLKDGINLPKLHVDSLQCYDLVPVDDKKKLIPVHRVNF